MRKAKNWEIGILLSSSGFEGVQFFDVTPKSQERVLSALPKLHHIFLQLDMEIKKIESGSLKGESENCNYN